GCDVDPGIRLGLTCRRKDELRETVHAPRLLTIDVLRRVEVLDLAREVHEVVARVELRDRPGPGLACDEVLPRRLDIVPERRHRAEPGDHDPPAPVHRTIA